MKIYKRSFFTIVKSFLLNLLATFIFLIVVVNLVDLLYGLIATAILYSVLMFYTFVIDNAYFTIDGTKFRKFNGKKLKFEYDVKNEKIKKDMKKGITGYSAMNILIGNKIVNCSILDIETFNRLFIDLSAASR
ncbi:hypothetical protein ACWOAQ_01405 [Helcococcus kunzii]|uniref:Uncharacterized protein n=1 Tax=Helcococcus kunzii ATCC 51366 TaxID=883114 RepID=H3NNS8_9FIRM|nr:hypothetical protein [Helcococcus kunzii]EHR34053.1 hypothetical protein HMPREF9709_00989 [Helcococcus kunzii ATCC 51366]MCT1795662.1 hypothetical protein [Helcococcus kunzii]MCT1988772.1 hypothetical protein [Helcococcus kunzii]QUY64901.1 hypothetical protein GUI37_04985 [Helcococcus kunzii]QZO75609.1 hypothetical protein HIF96_04820 [Helcococcus kunzii]